MASPPKGLGALALLGLAYPAGFGLLYFGLAAVLAFFALHWQSIVLTILSGLMLGSFIRYVVLLYRALKPVESLVVTEKEAPGLFKELRSIAARLHAALPDKVMLDGSLNAGVMTLPSRWLVPGHSKRTLLLGLPLMEGLDEEEFKAVLVHEMNSFSLEQPKEIRLAWRSFQLWLRIDREVSYYGGFFGRLLLGHFAKWHLARMNKALIPLAHEAELASDVRSVALAGREPSLRAMLLHGMLSKAIAHDVTDVFWDKARTLPEPPRGLFKEISACAAKRPSQEELDAQFARLRKSLPQDVPGHPSMVERLAALDCEKAPPMPKDFVCAAAKLLGESRDSLLDRVEAKWLNDARPSWRNLYEVSQGARQALSQMLNVDFKSASALQAKLRRAQLLEAAFGSASAIRPLEDILDEHPDCAEAKFNLGRIKLALGKDEGAALLRESMEAERVFSHLGFEPLSAFYRREGLTKELEDLEELRKSAPEPVQIDAKSNKPLAPLQPNIKSSWHLNSPKLRPEELEELLRILTENGNVASAYLAQIVPPSGEESEPFHALVVVRRFSLLAYRGEDDSALATELTLPLAKIQSLKVMPFDKCSITVKMKLKLLKDSVIFKA